MANSYMFLCQNFQQEFRLSGFSKIHVTSSFFLKWNFENPGFQHSQMKIQNFKPTTTSLFPLMVEEYLSIFYTFEFVYNNAYTNVIPFKISSYEPPFHGFLGIQDEKMITVFKRENFRKVLNLHRAFSKQDKFYFTFQTRV